MDSREILELAFGDTTRGTSIATQPGRWEASLPVLLSDGPEASTDLRCTALTDLDNGFSISTYLSPAGVGQVAATIVLHDSEPIEGALLACLALNEECRKKGVGVFYHLPPRQNLDIGHACDLVFSPKKWDREERYGWDKASWAERLDRYSMDQNYYGVLLI